MIECIQCKQTKEMFYFGVGPDICLACLYESSLPEIDYGAIADDSVAQDE